jgi:hypothetical protein
VTECNAEQFSNKSYLSRSLIKTGKMYDDKNSKKYYRISYRSDSEKYE